MKIMRAVPVFSVAFTILYVICMYFNLALVSYFPRTRDWYALTVTNLPKSAGPGMYWYGWLATATLGALTIAGASLVVPVRGGDRVWPALSWAVPTAMAGIVVFLLRSWFIH